MQLLRGWVFSLMLALCACSGSRHVERPTNAQGYKTVELRDVAPMGLTDVNVEVVGLLGVMSPQEVCDGLILFPLISGVASSDGNALSLSSDVTLSFPRSEYPKVRDLRPSDRVRVRGYLSTWFAQGCGWYSRDAHRYLWVDTIEPYVDAKPPKVEGQHQL